MALALALNTVAGPCQRPLCEDLALGEDCYCDECRLALCRAHFDSQEHICRYTHLDIDYGPNDRNDLRDDLDEDAMVRRLEELRPGHKCTIAVPPDFYQMDFDLTGGFNIHVVARYDDEVEWLIRLTGYHVGPAPAETRIRIVHSQALTHKVLHEAGVPVAELRDWGYGVFSKTYNPQCIHLIYDRMPGMPGQSTESLLGKAKTDDESLKSMVEQYVASSIKMSTLTFDAIGSFDCDEAGNIFVGTTTSFPWFDDTARAVFCGPFKTLRDYRLLTIARLLEAIRRGRMHRAGPLLPYLIFLDIRRMVAASPELARRETTFYVSHPDTIPINYLCTSDRLTAIVDWEWTTTTTISAAFGLPKWAEFDDEERSAKAEQMLCDEYIRAGRPDLAECVGQGALHTELGNALESPLYCYRSADSIISRLNYLTQLFDLDEDADRELPANLRAWGQWALERYSDDPHLSSVIELDTKLLAIRRPAVKTPLAASSYRRTQKHHHDYFVRAETSSRSPPSPSTT